MSEEAWKSLSEIQQKNLNLEIFEQSRKIPRKKTETLKNLKILAKRKKKENPNIDEERILADYFRYFRLANKLRI